MLNGDFMDILEIKNEALLNDVPIIKDDSLKIIVNLIKDNNIKNILEIGTAVAYSALSFVLAGADKVTTIERNPSMFEKAQANIKSLNMEDKINVIFGDALEVDISNFSKEFDLLFIDAAKAQNIKFFERYTPFLKDNGIVVVDNILFHGVDENDPNISKNLRSLVKKIKTFVTWLKENKEYETIFLNDGDGLAISRRIKC